MNLVIVESPTKAKTLAKFLGKDFEVESSKGHIVDLPKSKLGVDTEHNFEPDYIVIKGKGTIIASLKKEAKKAKVVYLATDPDREGEAISWHLANQLGGLEDRSKIKDQRSKIKGKDQESNLSDSSNSTNQSLDPKFKRVVFHEITDLAISEAFKSPKGLNFDLVDAYQARRVLDRLVGYRLSPLLWQKVAFGLSAGRVQSIAVRFIVEREVEREKFLRLEYWKISTELKNGKPFTADLVSKNDVPFEHQEKIELFSGEYRYTTSSIQNEAASQEIEKDLSLQSFIVKSIETKEIQKSPSPPFATATLQRTAATALGFTSQRTMRAAQALFEKGLITYHRTDSLNLSEQFLKSSREAIIKQFGSQFAGPGSRVYKTKSKNAQEAHEAIRPTDASRTTNEISGGDLSSDEVLIYDLIWKRAISSQMANAVYDSQRIEVKAGPFLLAITGSVIKFLGWKKVSDFTEESEERDEDSILPKLEVGQKLDLAQILPTQHFTSAPPRYNEGSLIKDLEKYGIGRPSTYAPTISTIQTRRYVFKEGAYFLPPDIGRVVNKLLAKHFPEIVDINFTAKMEEELDQVANGEKGWIPVVKEFYGPFEKRIEDKTEELKTENFKILEKTDEKCPQCQSILVVKLSRFGKFLSCSNYPECKFAKPILNSIGLKCPKCITGDMVIRKTRQGKTFFGCSRYPECDWASWDDPRRAPLAVGM